MAGAWGYSGAGNSGYYGVDGRTDNNGDTSRSAGGSGYYGNGASYSQAGITPYNSGDYAQPFTNGLRGGVETQCGYGGAWGGFGGGGTSHCHNGAGGGGYTGGAGGNWASWAGEGGGSLLGGDVTNQNTNVGLNDGNGYVTIELQ